MAKEGAWAIHATINARADGNSTYTNMPAADSFFLNSVRHVVALDLEGMTQIRLKVNKLGTAGLAGSKIMVRYSPTFSTSIGSYIDIGTSEVSVAIDVTNTYLISPWVDILDDAKTDVFVALIGTGGNGVLDPLFGNVSIAAV